MSRRRKPQHRAPGERLTERQMLIHASWFMSERHFAGMRLIRRAKEAGASREELLAMTRDLFGGSEADFGGVTLVIPDE